MISIEKHRAMRDGRPVAFKPSPNVGGVMRPEYIVLHDTASGLESSGPINWLTSRQSKVSAHFVVGRDGEITQLAPCNIKTWHAGQSIWKGRQYLNGFTIGIEIVNPGKMQRVGDGVYKALATIDTRKRPGLSVERRTTAAHGDGWWLHYTRDQVEAVTELCQAICAGYQIADILTHWMISPGRKVDTNPLFPLEAVKSAALMAKPVGFASIEGGEATDESAGGSGSDYQGDDFDAPHGVQDVDESVGAVPAAWRLLKSRIAQAAAGVGLGSVGSMTAFLTDWRVLGVLCLTAVCAGALYIIYRRSLVH